MTGPLPGGAPSGAKPGLPGLGLAKVLVAWSITLLGLLMPWRTRILFSEALGWIAQLVPPSLYTMEGPQEPGADPPTPEGGDQHGG
jgi:hypothetical protein